MLGMPYDALGTFLVFLIGVPALVIQSMDAEVRRAVMKRPLMLVLRAGWPFIIALLIIIAALIVLAQPDAALTPLLTNTTPVANQPATSPAEQIQVVIQKQLALAQSDQVAQYRREWV